MEYQSGIRIFGLPLVHVALGRVVDGSYRRGVATGWIAIGDISFGALFSLGGLAAGGISIGGLSLGALALGGFAVGGAAVGGLAAGLIGLGGAAFGWFGALGGVAIAHGYALGGVAIGHHANDLAAQGDFAVRPLVRFGSWVMEYPYLLILIPVTAGLIAIVKGIQRSARGE